MWDDERDARLRREAMAWLAARSEDGREPLTSAALLDFTFEGERFRLKDRGRGIRKPAVLAAALSITTAFTAEGATRPYEDATGPDGLIRYKWRGDDPQHADNRALREAWRRDVPLIWFFGVAQATYLPVFPVYVLGEEPDQQQFAIAHDAVHGLVQPGSVLEDNLRRYVLAQTRRRLHQPVFRAQVLQAYATRCAVCSLAHAQLLDAAHIRGDAAGGAASVRNGLAMCKIHHAAFDAHILGVRPDHIVEIRADLLEEVDGPMLRHGLQERHGQRLLVLPRASRERPDPALLASRYEEFRAAS